MMMSDTIDYGRLMHSAMRSLIQKVLRGVQADGLPGDHHFFINFATAHPDVELADWLRDRYPEEMTIVIQEWFDNLDVGDDGFSITLNFGNNPEPMYIPYDAIQTFVDPSVEFGLRFDPQPGADDQGDAEDTAAAKDPGPDPEPEIELHEATDDTPHEAEIVSLDQFRK